MNQVYSLPKSVQSISNETATEASSDTQISSKEEKPRKHIIQNILNYSKALKVEKSESVENIEIVLN